jgi:hypothetical protein
MAINGTANAKQKIARTGVDLAHGATLVIAPPRAGVRFALIGIYLQSDGLTALSFASVDEEDVATPLFGDLALGIDAGEGEVSMAWHSPEGLASTDVGSGLSLISTGGAGSVTGAIVWAEEH